VEDQASLEKTRTSLLTDIAKFNNEAAQYLDQDELIEELGTILYGDDRFEAEWDKDEDWAADEAVEDPAVHLIALPSALPCQEGCPEFTAVRDRELQLRRGQANDVLTTIREIVGQLSFQWSKGVRLAPDKVRQTRARKSIDKVHRQLSLKAKLYQWIRTAMKNLGMSEAELSGVYRPLSPSDISVSKAIKGPNERAESQTQLSWIWTTMHGTPGDPNYLTECMFRLVSAPGGITSLMFSL
jgi:hypothetical protein